MARASAWRKTRSTTVDLPSGLNVTLKRVTLLSLVEAGQVPAPLVAEMVDAEEVGKTGGFALMTDSLPAISAIYDAVATAVLINPRIVKQAEFDPESDDTILLSELSFEDKQFIFNYVAGRNKSLVAFRAESGPDVAVETYSDDFSPTSVTNPTNSG